VTEAAALLVDPTTAVDHAVVETLLRCWVREHGVTVDGDAVALEVAGGTITARVTHRSALGWHRFGPPRRGGTLLDAAAVVTLLAGQLGEDRDLVQRTVASRERILAHAADRTGSEPPSELTFLDGEQELVAGHPFHPASKSREDLGPQETVAYSPELRGSFHLRWLAVDHALVASGSALPQPAEDLLVALGDAPAAPSGTVAVPLHPWQAREVLARPSVAGLVTDLGEGGSRWYPTSSLRTVWRPDVPWMLKLSLGVRLTNSRRENRRDELRLGEQAHRIVAGEVGAALLAAHPRFRILSDPAWIGVDVPGGGFETGIRQNPFGLTSPVVCVAALVDERPGCGEPLLVRTIRRLAADTGRPADAVAVEWVRRYLREVVAPLLWLEGTWGIVLEAHHQNTLVTLDQGWPAGGWYRDNQGWYVAAGAADRLRRVVPDLDGVGAVFPDRLVAERGAYYLGVNNVFGLVGALAASGVADEAVLLGAVRAELAVLPPSPVLDLLLRAPRIPCKANLLTCADGRDELDGPVEHQSVYVEVRNPISEVPA
jgi:siderophore synthetase component